MGTTAGTAKQRIELKALDTNLQRAAAAGKQVFEKIFELACVFDVPLDLAQLLTSQPPPAPAQRHLVAETAQEEPDLAQ